MGTNDLFLDIVKNLDNDKRETLARFHEASKSNTWLPMMSLYLLPSGFLAAKLDEHYKVVARLSSFGMRVAKAAEALAQSEEAA